MKSGYLGPDVRVPGSRWPSTGPYGRLHSHTGPYGRLQSHTGPYGLQGRLQGHMASRDVYRAIWPSEVDYRAIWPSEVEESYPGPLWAIRDVYRAIMGHQGRLQGHMAPPRYPLVGTPSP